MSHALVLVSLLLSAQSAAPQPPKPRPPRVGVPILLQHTFQTNVVAICVGNVDPLSTARKLQAAVASKRAAALTVDDGEPNQPTYFFDADAPDAQINVRGQPYRLVLTLFTLHGLQNPALVRLAARGHEFLVVANSSHEAAAGVAALKEKLPADAWPRIHRFIVGAGETEASALHQIVQDVVETARRDPRLRKP